MVHYDEEETHPVSVPKLWSFLDLHTTAEIGRIHPEIKSQEIVYTTEKETVLKRRIDLRGQVVESTWKITTQRPSRTRWEVVGGNGPWTVGSYLENTYTAVPEGVKVRSIGDLRVVKVPFFLQKKVVRRVLDHISDQDRSYLKGFP